MTQKTVPGPEELAQDPQKLAETLDMADAAGFGTQALLRRQRVGAAQRRLERAKSEKAPPEEIARLERRVTLRQDSLNRAQASFAMTNLRRPDIEEDKGQLFGLIIEETKATDLTAALLGSAGEVLTFASVAENGSFLLSLDQDGDAVRLQISDGQQRILFRDAESFDLPTGQVVYREVTLTGPIKDPVPPPTQLVMPDLAGQTEAAACAALARIGITDIEIEQQPSDGVSGVVIGQSPSEGVVLEPDSAVKLTISQSGDGQNSRRVVVPNFVGRPLEEAEKDADQLGLKPESRFVPGEADPGTVMAQDPIADTVVARGAPVKLEASQTKTVTMPDLVGRQESLARPVAERLGLTVTVKPETSDATPGLVIAQEPRAGSELTPPAPVTLVVARARTVLMPNLIGQRTATAVLAAERLELKVTLKEEEDANVESGTVVAQDPEPGKEIQPGDPVTLLATPSKAFAMPNFVGRKVTPASQAGKRLGLEVTVTEEPSDAEDGTVTAQAPKAGTEVKPGDPVTLLVARRRIVRPGEGRSDRTFLRALGDAIRDDERSATLSISGPAMDEALADAGLVDARAVEKAIELDNAELQSRLKLRNRRDAIRFRSILKAALEKLR